MTIKKTILGFMAAALLIGATVCQASEYSFSLYNKKNDELNFKNFCKAQGVRFATQDSSLNDYPMLPIFNELCKFLNSNHSNPESFLYVIKSTSAIQGIVWMGPKDDSSKSQSIVLIIDKYLLDNPILETLLSNIFELQNSQQKGVQFIFHLRNSSDLQYGPLLKSLDFRFQTWIVPQCAGGAFYYKIWGMSWNEAEALGLCDNEEDNDDEEDNDEFDEDQE